MRTEGMRGRRRLPWRSALLAALCGGAAYGLSRLAAGRPELVERLAWVGPFLSRPLSRLTGVVPFAVGELLIAAYVVWLLVSAVRGIGAIRGGAGAGRTVAAGVLRRVRDAGVVIAGFYLLWGLGYARPGLEERLGWPEWSNAEVAELVPLAEEAVRATNDAYRALHGGEDAGAPTDVPVDRSVERSVDAGWARTAALLGLPERVAARYGRVKRPFGGEILRRFGIGGVYFPWTAEANVVGSQPAIDLPHTMAHEKAHQRGVAREAEASFLGYLAASLSGDPLARYSAAYFAQKQLLNVLAGASPDEWRRVAGERLPGVRRDVRAAAEYYAKYRGVTRTIGTAVNDRYLRANQVPGGVLNYGHAARLLVEFARRNGASILPSEDADG